MKIKKREKMYENNDNRKLMNNGNDVMKIEWNVFRRWNLVYIYLYILSTAMYHCWKFLCNCVGTMMLYIFFQFYRKLCKFLSFFISIEMFFFAGTHTGIERHIQISWNL